jgi:hypothetical protein
MQTPTRRRDHRSPVPLFSSGGIGGPIQATMTKIISLPTKSIHPPPHAPNTRLVGKYAHLMHGITGRAALNASFEN